ncbi:unnamed protein product [Polarella glacialis]|uniref:Uncharacterized protein n=1 Tax=Polarella glacialis TaxID=89957 RepID=A0A813GFI0_POLGL|nr:unnamed protein product [Polarella glacialis]
MVSGHARFLSNSNNNDNNHINNDNNANNSNWWSCHASLRRNRTHLVLQHCPSHDLSAERNETATAHDPSEESKRMRARRATKQQKKKKTFAGGIHSVENEGIPSV